MLLQLQPPDARPIADPAPLATPSRHRLVLTLLMLVGFFNMMDRQVVNILAEPIRRDLRLTDTQVGLITGLSFALFYTLMSLPIARLAERTDRRRIIALSLATWSAFTAVCAVVQSFGQLFVARMLVGVGEAGSTPATLALVADLTPKARRASALAFVTTGSSLGILAGLAFGGFVAERYGWRVAFLAAGLPGLALAGLVMLLVRDPRLGGGKSRGESPSLLTTFSELGRKASFWWFTAGSALLALCGLGFGTFAASYFLRRHLDGLAALAERVGAAVGQPVGAMTLLGVLLGLAQGLSGATGLILGGRLADSAVRRDPRGYMTGPLASAVLSAPLFLAVVVMDQTVIALMLLAIAMLVAAVATPSVLAGVQSVAPPASRATASAMLLVAVNFTALGLGPLTVGLVSDGLAPTLGEVEGLRWGLAGVTLACPLAAVCFWMARDRLGRDLES